jgi:hypothetical protein
MPGRARHARAYDLRRGSERAAPAPL